MMNYVTSSSRILRRVLLALGFLAFCALPFSASSLSSEELDLHDPVRQIRISLADETSERVLLEIGLELQAIDRQTRTVRAIANTYELGQLDQRGFEYTVEIEDLQLWYAARIANDATKSQEAPALGQWLSPPFGQGSMGNYYTLSEAISVINQIRNAYPSIVASPRPIGASLEGRRIWALSISDNPGVSEGEPEVRMDAIHHAREPMSMHAMIWYMLHLVENYGTDPVATYLVDHREQWFIPVVNPDGYAHNQSIAPNGGGMWRKNRRNNAGGSKGVDLNRNYDAEWGYDNAGSSPTGSSNTYRGTAPGSEPEVAAMMNFSSSHNFATALSLHSYGKLWLRSYGYDSVLSSSEAELSELGSLATEFNRYSSVSFIELYPANGVTVDYDHDTHGTYSYTPEVGNGDDGFWPVPSRIVPLAEENLQGLIRTALAAGVYLRTTGIQLTDVGNGDGFFEAGESVELEVNLRNSGRDSTVTSLIGSLTTSSSVATAGTGTSDFGVVASFSDASNTGSPLTLQISPTAALGDVVELQLVFSFNGQTVTFDLQLIVGERRIYVRDEVELDVGWTIGDPLDTATTGLWERAIPIATNYQGDAANPGDDATPGAGALCFVTGNGGGAAGDDDIDGGQTTLYSPPFDLEGVGIAYVEYSRWWSNLSNADDAFSVSITDDGGQNWVELETVSANHNEWKTVEFRLNDFVSLTADMQLRFVAADFDAISITEAGIDDLMLHIYGDDPRLTVYGKPAINTPIGVNVAAQAGDVFAMLVSAGTADLPLAGITGNFLLDPGNYIVLFQGQIPASRLRARILNVPNDVTLQGATVYWQAWVSNVTETWMTNRESMTFE